MNKTKKPPNLMDDIPFDTWTQVPNEKLFKKGMAEWVYRPSGYTGPVAIDGFIRKQAIDAPGSSITLSREEAEIFWPKEKPPNPCD